MKLIFGNLEYLINAKGYLDLALHKVRKWCVLLFKQVLVCCQIVYFLWIKQGVNNWHGTFAQPDGPISTLENTLKHLKLMFARLLRN